MIAEWKEKPLPKVLMKVPSTSKIKRKQYLTEGSFPIVSQEDGTINGYWNNEEDVIEVDRPVVIFGDHNQLVKFIDFSFVRGADGTKVLKVIPELEPKFFYYFLLANPVESKGYARHFRFIKELHVPIPPLDEQRRIVAVLDEAFAALDRARENVEANLVSVRELYEIKGRDTFHAPNEASNACTLGDVSSVISGAGFPKKYQGKSSGDYPFFKVSDMNTGGNEEQLLEANNYIDENIRKELGARLFPATSIVFPKVGGAIATDKKRVVVVSSCVDNNVMGLLPDENKIFPAYLHEWLRAFKIYEFSNKAALPSITQTTVKAWPIYIPSYEGQTNAVDTIVQLRKMTRQFLRNYQAQLIDIDDLRQSLLQRAFAGELTQSTPILAVNDNERDERLSTAALVLAFDKHLVELRQKTFGHVKARKTLHLTESIGGLDLGRQPQLRQAGPHDQEHFARVEAWAKQNGVFEFKQRRSGGYTFNRGTNYEAFLLESKTLLADYEAGLSRFLPLMVDMNTEEAEVFTTVHAAWNNLLADRKTPSDDDIVTAARENWHESKMDINRQHFFDAITKIRRHDLEPDGSAKYVSGAQESLI